MTNELAVPEVKLCPAGHVVGTAFGGGFRCSGRSCGEQRFLARKAEPPRPIVQQMPPEEMAIQKRHKLAGLPPGLEGEAALEWSQKKVVNMLPEAIAQLQWDLRYGSDKVRSETAAKVMAANGMDRRDAANARTSPTIVLNISGGNVQAPWLERLKK